MADRNPQGNFDLAWWGPFRRELWKWAATRKAKLEVLNRNAEAAFPALTETWTQCCAPLQREGSDITSVSWDSVTAWVRAVAAIKPTDSPVFRAKFSHFLLPQVFPVVDGGVMHFPFGGSYQAHFEGVQREWATTSPEIQQQLQSAMCAEVGAPLVPTYPVVNKIVEICLIGRRQPS